MSTQVAAAVISGVVAILIAGSSGLLTWIQVRKERTKWLVDTKVAYSLELFKARLSTYPELLRIISPLSTRSVETITPERAKEVANEINDWFYSSGGLCAEPTTRGALLGLREACDRWASTGRRPAEFYAYRNFVIAYLRRDLDLGAPESFDFANDSTLLSRLQEDLELIEQERRKRPRKSGTVQSA